MNTIKPKTGCNHSFQQISLFFIALFIAFTFISTQVFGQGETCSTAVLVTPGTYNADGPATGSGAVNICSFPIVGTATHADWYKYVAPADGTININSCMGGADTRLSVFTGSCEVLYCYAFNDDACQVSSTNTFLHASQISNVPVNSGVTYYIQWDNRWESSGFEWTLEFSPYIPYNDTPCDNAILIYCGDLVHGSTYGATTSDTDLPCSGYGSGKDVFYNFTATAGEVYTVSLSGSGIDGVLSAYTGNCNYFVDLLDCSDNIGTGVDESITFSVDDSYIIWLRVFNYYSNGATFDLSLACSNVTNDNCSGAENIVVNGPPILGYNTQAALDPDLSIDCGADGDTGIQHSVWYSFTAPPTGKVVIETFAGSLTDSQLQVYDACGGNVVGCDDDGGVGLMSKITLDCDAYVPYETYYILVDGWSGAQGYFDISVVTEACPAPENDACADPILIPVDGAAVAGTNSGATGSPEISIDCGYGSDQASTNDVWYYFVAPVTGIVTVETFAGTLGDSQLQILDACGGNVIACNEDGGVGLMSKITLPCDSYIPGNTYLVQVDGWLGSVGTFSISVTTSACPAPDNDVCADAVELTVHAQGDCPGNEVTGTTSGATSDGLDAGCESSNPDVFYSFNSGDNTSVVINLDGINATDLVITVLEGSCSGANIFCFANSSPYTVEVSPSTNYIVRIGTNLSYGDPGTFGICIEDGYDCFDLQANIGDACDDGSALTENDVLIEGCTCQGTPINDLCADAETLTVNLPDECTAENQVMGTTNGALPDIQAGGCDNGESDLGVFYAFNSGNYNTVIVNFEDLTITDWVITVYEGCGGTPVTCTVDGVSLSVPTTVNTDYVFNVATNPNFGETGTFNICLEGVYNCPDLNANIGDACDDGNPNTTNDVVTADCACVGTVVYDCPDLNANIGDSCDDGNPNTTNDIVTADCACVGTIVYDCPDLNANIGDSCNDGNPLTENDVIIEGCTCQGSPPNDDCADAETLTVHAPGDCTGNETLGTTSGATSTPGSDCETSGLDVYYTFNAGSYENVIINLSAITATDLVISVLEGGCGSTAIYSCYIGTNQTLNVNVTPGETYTVRIHSLGSSYTGDFNICIEGVSSGSAALTGTITGWNSNCGDRAIAVSLYDIGAGTFYGSLPGVLHSDGTFELSPSVDILPGTYTILVKVSGALAIAQEDVAITTGSNSISVPVVKLGDVNNDNFINFVDVSILNAAFGSATGDGNFNPAADLNCDGFVNFVDVSILNSNFGQSGDTIDIL